PLRFLLRGLQERSVPHNDHGRARARGLQVSRLRRQEAGAAHGRLLLEDIAEGLSRVRGPAISGAGAGEVRRRLDATRSRCCWLGSRAPLPERRAPWSAPRGSIRAFAWSGRRARTGAAGRSSPATSTTTPASRPSTFGSWPRPSTLPARSSTAPL